MEMLSGSERPLVVDRKHIDHCNEMISNTSQEMLDRLGSLIAGPTIR